MEGCGRVSPIVAATGSLHLYINRVLLNLEEDRTLPTDPLHVHVTLPMDARREWVWRKNFRVWQVNRKVFLFTHHYIEPSLLDRKTPLFEELESTLLQKDISADTALDAYGAYLSGFDDVAHLSIAGSFHDVDNASARDVLHLLGVTPSDHRSTITGPLRTSPTARSVRIEPSTSCPGRRSTCRSPRALRLRQCISAGCSSSGTTS